MLIAFIAVHNNRLAVQTFLAVFGSSSSLNAVVIRTAKLSSSLSLARKLGLSPPLIIDVVAVEEAMKVEL